MLQPNDSLKGALVATGITAILLGGTYATWRWVTSLHPATPVMSQQANATVTNASVDPGTSLDARVAPNFTLTNQFGQSVALRDFRGKTVVLTFIDSKCDTVCPLTAVTLKNLMNDLGSYQHDVQLVAINANPVATSVKAVYDWSASHGMLHQWQFLTGSSVRLSHVWSQYAVSSQVLHGSLVEHIPAVYVIDPQGRERWLYLNSSSVQAPVVSAQVQQLVDHVAPLLPGKPSADTFAPARQLEYLPSGTGPAASVARSFTLPAIFPTSNTGVLNGSSLSVGHGGHAVLLEFFATWCPDCQEEIPALKRYAAYAQAHPGWPTLVAIDLRQSEPSTAHVEQYMQSQHLNFPVGLDTKSQVSALYGVTGIPTQALVSGNGHILWYHQGLVSLSDLQQEVRTNVVK